MGTPERCRACGRPITDPTVVRARLTNQDRTQLAADEPAWGYGFFHRACWEALLALFEALQGDGLD